MAIFFSGIEVLEVAIKIEKNGFDFYKALLERTENQRLKKIYEFLAEQEKKHISDFKKLYKNVPEDKIISPFEDQAYIEYLNFIADTQVFTDKFGGKKRAIEVKTEIEALELAIKFEKDSLLFYYSIKDYVKSYGEKVLEEIISQERDHIRILSSEREKIKQGSS